MQNASTPRAKNRVKTRGLTLWTKCGGYEVKLLEKFIGGLHFTVRLAEFDLFAFFFIFST